MPEFFCSIASYDRKIKLKGSHVGLSLQDQLKKSGLVDEKKAKQLERAKRKESKQPQQKKTVKKSAKQETELARKSCAKSRSNAIASNEERNRDGEWRAKMAQIRQLIEANAMKVGGELKFNFKHENKVKQIWVDARTREQLSGGTSRCRIKSRWEICRCAGGCGAQDSRA